MTVEDLCAYLGVSKDSATTRYGTVGCSRSAAFVLVRQTRERDEASGAGDSWHDEAVDIVRHRPRHELTHRPVLAHVGSPNLLELGGALTLKTDRGRVAEAYEYEVE
jgi:hypothetical protein